jgi:hypothetical protein
VSADAARREARALALCSALLLAALAVLLRAGLFTGRGLLPTDGVLRFYPWRELWPGNRGSNYALSDQFLNFVPLARLLHAGARRGRLTLWNPYLSCGLPLLASIQAAALYPVNLLLLPFDQFSTAGLAALLKLFVAGFFTLLFLRRLGAGWLAALASALTFALSGFMICWLGHPHANAACLLPALLYCAERGVAERRPRAFAGLAVVYACVLLGGHPPTAVHETLLLAAYALWRTRGARGRGRLLVAGAAALALGALIAAPQLLPYLSYSRESATVESSARLARWSTRLSPGTLPDLLIPKLTGDPVDGYEYLGAPLGVTPANFASFDYSERTGYVGVVALALALAAALFRRDGPARFFAAAAAVSLAWAYGLPPLPQLAARAPLLKMINPTRLLLVFDFSAAALAGLGLDALPRIARERLAPGALAAALAAAALLLFFLIELYLPLWPQMRVDERAFMAGNLGLFVANVAVAAAALVGAQRGAAGAAPLCVAWLALDLLHFGAGYNPAVARRRDYPQVPVLSRLAAEPGPFRVIGLGDALPPDTGMIYGLQDARGQDFVGLRRYEELVTGRSGDFYFYSWARALPPALPLLDVRYALVAPGAPAPAPGWARVDRGGLDVYKNPDDPGRALVVRDARVLAPEAALALARSPGFDPRRAVLLESPPAAPPPGPAAAPEQDAAARVAVYEPDRVDVEASSPAPAFLVLLDAFDPGWAATVDGRPAPVLRADYAFRAVAVPAGRSLVRFDYRPASLRWGLALGALGLALAALAARATRAL